MFIVENSKLLLGLIAFVVVGLLVLNKVRTDRIEARKLHAPQLEGVTGNAAAVTAYCLVTYANGSPGGITEWPSSLTVGRVHAFFIQHGSTAERADEGIDALKQQGLLVGDNGKHSLAGKLVKLAKQVPLRVAWPDQKKK